MPNSDQPRLFRLDRDTDITGVSGTGTVADGVVWPDGTVSIRWCGPRPSVVFWNSLENAKHVHGHAGATRFVFLDEQMAAALHSLIEGKNAELKSFHLDARIGGLNGTTVVDILSELDHWHPDDPAASSEFRTLWQRIHSIAHQYDANIAAIRQEASKDIPGIDTEETQ